MTTITQKTLAWLTKQDSLNSVISSKNISTLGYTDSDMKAHGWACIGDATITVELHPQEAVVTRQVEQIEKEIQAVRAQSQSQIYELEAKKQSLLAITLEPPNEAA